MAAVQNLPRNLQPDRTLSLIERLKVFVLAVLFVVFLPLYAVCFCLGFILSFIPIFPTKTARENLSQRLGVKGLKASVFIAHIYLNYVFYGIEAFLFNPLGLAVAKAPPRAGLSGHEAIDIMRQRRLNKNSGVVFVLGHLSNVEMYLLPLSKALSGNQLIYALAKPARLAFLNRILLWYRKRPHFDVLWTDKTLAKKLSQACQRGHSIALLVDQKPSHGGEFLPFFGKMAAFPSSGLRFCMNHDMTMIYAAGRRLLPGFFEIKYQLGQNTHQSRVSEEDPRPNEEATRQALTHELTCFAAWLEQEIQQSPTQWTWDYRKWSRQPPLP